MLGRPARSRRTGLLLACALTVACAAGARADDAPFTEEAVARGLVYVPNQNQPFGDGLAFADLDDDGDADVLAVGAASGVVGVFENDGTGRFTDRSASSGLAPHTQASGVTAADVDGDGDLDVHLARWGAPNVLYRNDGGFAFTDVSAAAGVDDAGHGAGCAWTDFDHDGDVDLYVANWQEANRLYRNRGDGTFEDVATELGVALPDQHTFQASFLDHDRDGDADLYLSNSYGQHCATTAFRNYLFENVAGAFIDVTAAVGAEACVDSMSNGIGDFDGNGFLDVYCTDNNVPGNALLLGRADGTFLEDAAGYGVESFASAWGAAFLDCDHDGWLDLYVCNVGSAQSNRLYRHRGTPPCTDDGVALGVGDTGASFAVATADVDRDGDLDLLVLNRQTNLRLFVNHGGGGGHWARFDVRGTGGRRHALNASVDVRTGATRRLREVIAGAGYKSQDEFVLHVGLAGAAVLDEVLATWPGGTTRTILNLPADATWTIVPPDGLGDGDFDGDRDLDDAAAFLARRRAAFAPGGEPFDFNGDSTLDDADATQFLLVFDGPQDDCDRDGTPDLEEILLHGAPDLNANARLDACEDGLGDLDGSGAVGPGDLAVLFASWGTCAADCPADLTTDGAVGFADLALLLSRWGA